MKDRDDSRLNDYLDDELGDAARLRLEEDVRTDVSLRARLRDLETLRDELSNLPRTATPPARVWAAIEAQIGDEGASGDPQVLTIVPGDTEREGRDLSALGRRISFSIPQLAAAAVILLSLGGLGAWAATSNGPVMDRVIPIASPTAVQPAGADPSSLAPDGLVLQYETSIAQLSAILEAGQGVLSPETLQVVRESLAAIDAAVEEALVALDDDPSNEVARRILQLNLDKKVDLLQRTAEAVQEIAD